MVHTCGENEGAEEVPFGWVELGSYMYARGAALNHWQSAIEKVKETVTVRHQLLQPGQIY